MQADIGGAIRIARLAEDFDWQWTEEGVERFCRAAQLRIEQKQPELALVHTPLRVDPPIGFLMASQDIVSRYGRSAHSMMQLMLQVTDTGDEFDPGGHASLVDKFGELSGSFIAEFGDPTRTSPGENAEIGWDFGAMTMLLAQSNTGIHLDLTNPMYLQWWDEQDELDREEAEQNEPEHPVDEDLIRANGPQTWKERRAALLAALTRLRTDIELILTTRNSRTVTFSMGERQLTCRVLTEAHRDEDRHGKEHRWYSRHGWTFNSLPTQHYWERSMAWPARYSAYEAIADAAILALRKPLRVAHPSDIIARVP